jgi:peroxiredoxin-like protein
MTHHYPVQLTYQGGKTGAGTILLQHGRQPVPLAVPAEFQGSGEGTSPEELLAAAIAGCYAVTLGIVAEHRRLPVARLEVTATGEVEQDGPRLTYKGITIRPTIHLLPGATDEQAAQALDVAHRAEKYCIITNAVRSSMTVTVEPTIAVG